MAKYIPPQLRNSKNSTEIISNHASLRMQQRGIDCTTLQQTIDDGVKEEDVLSSTYRTPGKFCVVSSEQKIITTMPNYRNTKFDLLRKTKIHEQQLLTKVAKNNDVAMCELAEFYLNEKLDIFDVKKAYNLFLRATKHQNSHAMCKLAELYDSNLLGSPNQKLYLEWMTKAANKGNKYATAVMGEYFMNQYIKLPPDISLEQKTLISSKAMKYFEQSAAKGSTRGMWHIAYIYQTGLFGEKNLVKAVEIFIKAASRGSPSALGSLQNLVYSKNMNADKLEDILNYISPIIGNQSSQIAVELGLAQIQSCLGKNKEAASIRGITMLEQAANNRNEDAIVNLIDIYKHGTNFIELNLERSLFWANKLKRLYEKVAEEGNIDAMCNLGELHLSGDLGEINYDKALKYFYASIKSGRADYIYNLGMKLKTDPTIIDTEEGAKLINKAIDIWKTQVNYGDIESAINIAEIYYDGDLGQADYEEAIKWFSIAANHGDNWAKYYLAKIYLVKLPDKDLELAINYIEQVVYENIEIDLQEKIDKLLLNLPEENITYYEGLNTDKIFEGV
ncbi:MAG: hypothetical protein DGJ47_000643 [Rickettsiaceae bacterium]